MRPFLRTFVLVIAYARVSATMYESRNVPGNKLLKSSDTTEMKYKDATHQLIYGVYRLNYRFVSLCQPTQHFVSKKLNFV